MAAALPDPTWHSISGYLSHPVCPLLALQLPSNRVFSTFAQWKRNVGLVQTDLNGQGVLMHAVKGFGHTSTIGPIHVKIPSLKQGWKIPTEPLSSDILLSILPEMTEVTSKETPRSKNHNIRAFLSQDHISNLVSNTTLFTFICMGESN